MFPFRFLYKAVIRTEDRGGLLTTKYFILIT
jgi:hypothetical protein